MRELGGLRHISQEIKALGGRVFAISTEPWGEIPMRRAYAEGGLTHLSDPDERIIATYGLRDSALGEAVARPASFIVGRDGRIAWRYIPQDWRLRAGPDVYMNAMGRIMAGGGPP